MVNPPCSNCNNELSSDSIDANKCDFCGAIVH